MKVYTTLISLLAVLLVCNALESTDPIVVGQTFLAGSTDPTSGSTGWALASHGIAEKLFTVDKEGEIIGQIAKSVHKVSNTTWDVTLKSGYKFSDGTVVNAKHVADCLLELNKKNPSAQSSLDVMTTTSRGELVVRIESSRVTHVMDAVLAEWVFVVYLKKGNGFVFTGPYVVDKFVAGSHIDLVPNEFYNQASRRSKLTVKKVSGGDALAAALENRVIEHFF